MKFHHQNSKSHNLFNSSPRATIANPTTTNPCMIHNYHYSCSTTIILLSSTKDLGGRGRSEEKGFHAVNSK
jgi:hypothetical protein